MIDALRATKHSLALAGPSLTAEVAATWIACGVAESLADWQRRAVERRQQIALEYLDGLDWRGRPCSPFLWVPLPEPWRATQFVRAARHRGGKVLAAEDFVVGRADAPHNMRVGISSAQSDEQLRQALVILVDLLASDPTPDLL